MLGRRGVAAGIFACIGQTASAGPILQPTLTPFNQLPATTLAPLPAWRANAAFAEPLRGRPAITIVLDDLGVMQPGTSQAVALPGPLTLSWFPFARHLTPQIAAASARGHETTLHMPMQAHGNSIAQTGPDPLRIDVPAIENTRRLQAAIAAIPDCVGINNHMGSVATLNAPLMDLVAQEAMRRGLLFLDSVTVPHSIGESRARAAGVPAASRDVFLDHVPTLEAVRTQLVIIEAMARSRGSVVAIGHPHPWTLTALESWLPGLEAKGFVLWPLSAAIARSNLLVPPGHFQFGVG
jgi:polysaccharide deacetylase 2 family uncharacterized protein YibQ